MKTEVSKLTQELRDAQINSEKIETQLKQELCEMELRNNALRDTEKQVSGLLAALSTAESENSDLAKKVTSLSSSIDQKEKECKDVGEEISKINNQLSSAEKRIEELLRTRYLLKTERDLLSRDKEEHEENIKKLMSSNLDSMPWLAGMMADFMTYDIEVEAKKLEWGRNKERAKKVASLREIRAEAQRRIEEAKIAQYQIEYLKQLYPAIEDILETDFSDLEMTGTIPEYDPVRKYLDKDEWLNLSESERNQLALDRYVASRKKSKWQIGRDYELAVAYEYSKKGYSVDTHGSYMGLSDMGRDVIATRGNSVLIIQCKYWGHEKTIHEKHIFQLFGSVVSYCMETGRSTDEVKGVFVTNITLSKTARRVAEYLEIAVVEHHKMAEFPRIKCNIGSSKTKIYHLPMDNQYDTTQITNPGEFYAFTVEEAEKAGFRRAYKWHGNS